MKNIAIINHGDNYVFGDLGKALGLSFGELGWNVVEVETESEIRSLGDIDYAIILAPFDYQKIRAWLPKTRIILYQLEILPWTNMIGLPVKRSLNKKWIKLNKLIQLNYDIIWDFTQYNIENNLKRTNSHKTINYFPIGYSPIFDMDYLPETIRSEVLFLGCSTNRRSIILNSLWSMKCKLNAPKDVYGSMAIQLMKNADINLNLHNNDVPVFEAQRVVQMAFSNKCFVISEPCIQAPFQHGKHWIVTEQRMLLERINEFLKKPDERKQIAQNAYDYIKSHYTITQHLEKIVGKLEK